MKQKKGSGDGDGTFLETSKGGLEAWGRAWDFFMAIKDRLKLRKAKRKKRGKSRNLKFLFVRVCVIFWIRRKIGKKEHAFVNSSPIILNFDLCGFEEEKGKGIYEKHVFWVVNIFHGFGHS